MIDYYQSSQYELRLKISVIIFIPISLDDELSLLGI